MPNWKFPCVPCKKPVKSNQKGLQCNTCKKWVHLKCTNLTIVQYKFLEENEELPFYCLKCKNRSLYTDLIFDNTIPCISNNIISPNIHSSNNETNKISTAHCSAVEPNNNNYSNTTNISCNPSSNLTTLTSEIETNLNSSQLV